MKKENNFKIAGVQPHGVASLLRDYFSFNLVLLVKVLLIKKSVYVYFYSNLNGIS